MRFELPRAIRTVHFACAVALATLACDTEEGGYGRPGIDTGPVAPMTLQFKNSTGQDIFLRWTRNHAELELARNGEPIATDRECIPMCDDGCRCDECKVILGRVRRVPAGSELVLEWEPLHYVLSTCNGSRDCFCNEIWPLTAGAYDVELEGFTDAEGGYASAEDPNVLIGANPGNSSKHCTARSDFSLEGGAVVEANFVCSF